MNKVKKFVFITINLLLLNRNAYIQFQHKSFLSEYNHAVIRPSLKDNLSLTMIKYNNLFNKTNSGIYVS